MIKYNFFWLPDLRDPHHFPTHIKEQLEKSSEVKLLISRDLIKRRINEINVELKFRPVNAIFLQREHAVHCFYLSKIINALKEKRAIKYG